MIATPARMTAAATTVRTEMGSFANAHPSNTAITGFTYAYVAAFAALTAPSR